MNDLVTIIVPIFNAETFLFECLDSLRNQTYQNIEILMINDGSTDASADICRKFLFDKRFKLYSKKNEGVSSARNLGLLYVNGNYVCFVDADDYVNKDIIEKCVSSIKKYNSEMVLFNMSYLENDELHIYKKFSSNLLDVEKYVFDVDYRHRSLYFNNVVNKMYKSNIILENCILFPLNMNIGEDLAFNLAYLKLIKNICLLDDFGYVYRKVSSSATHVVQLKKLIADSKIEIDIMKKFYFSFKRDFELIKRVFSHYCIEKTINIFNAVKTKEDSKDFVYFLGYINDNNYITCLDGFKFKPILWITLKLKSYFLFKFYIKVLSFLSQIKKIIKGFESNVQD